MPSDSVSSFIDKAKASRVIPPEQLDELIGRPGVPQEGLAEVCEFLLARGVLTRYQAELIRDGRAAELTFAGYPVLEEAGPCPGGTAYRALHPSLRTPVVLRRLRRDAVGDVAAFVERARAACPVVHPHLAQLLDAGAFRDEPFVTLEPFDGADLGTLVTDIGAMPTALAAGYGWQVASALQTAHARGLAHGGVRPGVVFVGPLVPMAKPRDDGTPRQRPGPTAVVKLFELGLLLPTAEPADPAYAPPERPGSPTPGGDVYGLGATLVFLLTARPPGEAPLTILRPDLPAELAELIRSMTAPDPRDRPTAAAAAQALARLAGLPVAPPVAPPAPPVSSTLNLGAAPAAPPAPADSGVAELAPAEAQPTDVLPGRTGPSEPEGGWVATPYHGPETPDYTPAAIPNWPGAAEWAVPVDPTPSSTSGVHARPATPSPRERAEARKRLWMWVAVGGGLNVLAILGWIYLFAQPGCSGGNADTQPRKAVKQRK